MLQLRGLSIEPNRLTCAIIASYAVSSVLNVKAYEITTS